MHRRGCSCARRCGCPCPRGAALVRALVRPRLARNLEKRLAQSGAVQITCIRGDDSQLAFGDEARVRLPLYSPERVRALTDDVGELGVELRQ